MPGWSRRELDDSLELVRDFMTPDWDIHPEMVTHTWVIDTKTGRPYPERDRAVHGELGLERRQDRPTSWPTTWPTPCEILKNVGLPCEGITTPGGFGNRVLPELAQATLQACATCSRRRFRTTSGTSSPTTQQRRPAGANTPRGLDGDDPRVRRLDHRLHRRLVRRLGRPGRAARSTSSSPRTARRPAARSDRPRRAGDPRLPLAGHLLQRRGDRLQHLQGSRAAAARALRQPDLDEAQRDRPLLGRARS